MQVDFIFQILVLIMSVVIHEVSHGYAALALGDQTAKYEGRLTLNPINHIDPVGSILVPSAAYFLGGFIFGWAKPVPYNPYNLRPGRFSEAIVSFAGPAANIAMAVIFGLFLRFVGEESSISPAFIEIATVIVFINILLAVFNMVPIPPLDGSKVLFALLPQSAHKIRASLERYWLMLVIFFIFFLWQFVLPVVSGIFRLITGIAF